MLVDITRHSLKNHLAFTQAEFMKSLATKIRPFGFQHFSYIRILDQHQRMLLTTDPTYSELSIKKNFHKFAFFGPPESYFDGVFLNDFLNLGEARPALAAHGIVTAFIIIKKRKNFVEHYGFGAAKKDPTLNNFIINNLDLFEQTIQEFDDRAKPLIKQYEHTPLFYPSTGDTTGLADPNLRLMAQKDFLSVREREIFYYVKRGFSSKEIAQRLNVSYRTVEKHVENMFVKTNAHSRIELLQKINF